MIILNKVVMISIEVLLFASLVLALSLTVSGKFGESAGSWDW